MIAELSLRRVRDRDNDHRDSRDRRDSHVRDRDHHHDSRDCGHDCA